MFKLGVILAKTNQLDQAIRYFQNSIVTSNFSLKRRVDTQLKIGILHELQQQFEKATHAISEQHRLVERKLHYAEAAYEAERSNIQELENERETLRTALNDTRTLVAEHEDTIQVLKNERYLN